MWVLVIFFLLSLVLNVALSYLLVKFIKRLFDAEKLMNEINDVTDSLIDFCESLKKKSLFYYSPEIQNFHRLVIDITKPLEKIRKEPLDG